MHQSQLFMCVQTLANSYHQILSHTHMTCQIIFFVIIFFVLEIINNLLNKNFIAAIMNDTIISESCMLSELTQVDTVYRIQAAAPNP